MKQLFLSHHKLTLCLSVILLLISTWLPAQIITTVAGSDLKGDGGPATAACLNNPSGAAVDKNGAVYIVDQGNNRIRKVATNGIISTVGGNGFSGGLINGDGGSATATFLTGANSVVVDDSGNLYISEQYRSRIRKVSTTGIITTIAGNGSNNASIIGDGGLATDASLAYPAGLALDAAGNLYIADQYNHRIRKIDSHGIITTVAGDGNQNGVVLGDGGIATRASLDTPTGVAVDKAGTIYVVDTGHHRIRKVDSNGIITTVEGSLGYPNSIAVDEAGNLYIADSGTVRKISTTGIITTVAGNGSTDYGEDGTLATETSLNNPVGVALDTSGNLYITLQYGNRIRKVSPEGIITTVAGNGYISFNGDGGLATTASLYNPFSVATDSNDNLYITDLFNRRIRKVSPDGIISTVAGNGNAGFSGDGGLATATTLNGVYNMIVDAAGNLYMADLGNHRIRKVSPDGIITTIAGNGSAGFSGDNGPAILASLNKPADVAMDRSGNLYIAELDNHRIRKIDSNGMITTVAGNGNTSFSGDGGLATAAGLNSPAKIVVDRNNNLYMADQYDHRIRKIDSNGIITTIAGNGNAGFSGDSGLATAASLNNPTGMALDRSGNLYIAELDNHRIRKIDSNGMITTVAGNGNTSFSGDGGLATAAGLNSPAKIVVDRNNNLYMADQYDHRIRKIDSNGIITTIAGNGNAGFSGDSGLATAASLNNPTGMALDNGNNLYIADLLNHRIRKVSSDGIITTVVGSDTVGFSGDGGLATAASLLYPSGVSLDRRGNFYIADEGGIGGYRIRKVTSLVTVDIMSVKDGNWSNASTWNCNCVPTLDDVVTISNGHNITVNQAVQIQALKQLGTLLFDASGSIKFMK